MNPKLKAEATALAAKIRTTLTTAAGHEASLETTRRQQIEVQKTVDDAVAQGAIDDEKSVGIIANQNARLQLFPSRIRQIETARAEQEPVLQDCISAAHSLLGRIASATEADLLAQITKLFTPLISEAHRVESLAQQAVRFCDRNISAHNASSGLSPMDLQIYAGKSLVPLAERAAAALEAVRGE